MRDREDIMCRVYIRCTMCTL